MQPMNANAGGVTLFILHTRQILDRQHWRGLKASVRDQTKYSIYQYSDQHDVASLRCVLLPLKSNKASFRLSLAEKKGLDLIDLSCF